MIGCSHFNTHELQLENLVVLQHLGLETTGTFFNLSHDQLDLPGLQVGNIDVRLARQFGQLTRQHART